MFVKKRKHYAIYTFWLLKVRKPFAISTFVFAKARKPYAICTFASTKAKKPFAICIFFCESKVALGHIHICSKYYQIIGKSSLEIIEIIKISHLFL